MNKTYLFFSFFLASLSLSSQTRTVGLVQYSNKQKDGYCLFSPVGTKKTFLMDKCGRKINEWTSNYPPGLSVCLTPDGDLLRAGSITNPYFGAGVGGIIERFDWSGTRTWHYKVSDSTLSFHHDFKLLPNGNILAIIWERHTAKDAIENGRNPANTKLPVWSERIEEIQPLSDDSANIVWSWRVWDHLIQDYDSTKSNYGVVKNHRELFDINFTNGNNVNYGQDWFHFNSVDYNPFLDQILISSHSLDEIYIIDHSTNTVQAAEHTGGRSSMGGDILYRWGNSLSYKTGGLSNNRLYHSHHATWIQQGMGNAGKILVFNNGLDRPVKKYSSIDVIQQPPLKPNGTYTYTAGKPYGPDSQTVVYKAKNTASFYSTFMGGVFEIDNGQYLITDAYSGTIFEVKNDTVLWKYINPYTGTGATKQGQAPGNNNLFRCQFYPASYSGFTGKSMAPGLEIEANPDSVKLCDKPIPPLYSIRRINKQNAVTGVADSLNIKCRISGTIQGINLSSTGTNIVIADSSDAMRVYSPKSTFGNTFSQGDSILVSGTMGQENGWGTLLNLDTIIIISHSKPVKPAIELSTLSEKNESDLVLFHRVKLTNPIDWPTATMSGNNIKKFAVQHTDGKTDSVFIYAATDVDGTPVLSGYLDIKGIEGQFDPTKPYNSNYAILPRGLSDFSKSSLPAVNFIKSLDSAGKNAGTFNVVFNNPQEEDFTFQLVVKSGTALVNQDYFYTEQTVSSSKTTGVAPVTILINQTPVFTGTRNIVFAIRKINGPGMIGPDSVFALQLPGKIESSNGLVASEKPAITTVFPNPGSDKFTVISAKPIVFISITDATGKTLYQSSAAGERSTYSPDLPSGFYNIKIQNNSNEITIKKWVVVK